MMTGPYVRFTVPVIWGMTTVLLVPWIPESPKLTGRRWYTVLFFFGIWCGGLAGSLRMARHDRQPLTDWWYRPATPPLRMVTTDEGLWWWVGSEKYFLFEAPVPSGNQVSEELQLIDPERGIRGGVYVPK